MTTALEPELFTSLDPPRLAGSCCASCGCVAFPVQRGCARCAGSETEPVELPDRGTLWTFTVQSIEPKAPYRPPAEGFEPYAVGYVDLGDVIVESRLVGAGADLQIDAPMSLTLLPLRDGPDGAVVTFAFAPDRSAL